MFGPATQNSKFSLANIIEEQLGSISLGGSQLNLEAENNVLSALEDSHSDIHSDSSGSLSEPRRNSGVNGKEEPVLPIPQDETKVVDKLTPPEVRWFYKETGNKNWIPFGGYDTLSIEAAFAKLPTELRGPRKASPKLESVGGFGKEEDESVDPNKPKAHTVLVLRGLYELNLISRTCTSIYWPGETFVTTRGTWFYESWQPLDEEPAEIIEQDHLNMFLGKKPSEFALEVKPVHNQSLVDLNVDWYSPAEVYVYSRGTPSKLVRSFTKKLGYFQKTTGTRVLRGYKTLATDSDKHRDISHLVFVVHGIGQKMNIGAQIFRNTTVIRERVASLKEKYFPDSNQRAEFFPVEWRSKLVLDGGTVDAITPPHIKPLRQVLNTSAMDIMYYTSPIYCAEIQDGVVAEMNRLYSMFCERNPHIKPKVSVIAHSLGAVIVYDIVTGYLPMGTSSDVDVIPGKSRLNFELDNFFCLGSPLSVFMALRAKRGEHHMFPPSLCNRLYNIYHLTDPVAYRLEPLIVRDYAKIAPLRLNPFNAVKPVPYSDMPLELEEPESTMSQVPMGEASSSLSPTETPSKDKGWSIWNSIWKGPKNPDNCQTTDSPTQGMEHRLDYVLTSGTAGPLIVRSVLVSHTAYWSNNDVAFFVLTRIFPELETELCSEERYGKSNGRRSNRRRRAANNIRKRKFDATCRSLSKCVSQTKRRFTRIWTN